MNEGPKRKRKKKDQNSEVFQVEVEMRQALLLAAAGQQELVLQRVVVVVHRLAPAAAVPSAVLLLLLQLCVGLRLGGGGAGGPVQDLAVEHGIAHLRAAVPVAAVAGALPVAQVLRHVQHAAVVGHEPGVRRRLAVVVRTAVQCRHAQVEAKVGHRERVEHGRRRLQLLALGEAVRVAVAVGGSSGLTVVVPTVRQRRARLRGGARGDWLVRGRVDASLPELLLEAAVPEVLDLVVRPPRQVRRDLRPPAWIIRLLVHHAGHERSCQFDNDNASYLPPPHCGDWMNALRRL